MSFSQANKTNIKVCDGCEKRCTLGIYEETLAEAKCKSKNLGQVKQFAYPTIADHRINDYYDEDGHWNTVVFDVDLLHQDDVIKRKEYEKRILQKAREIAKLCDNYKTR